MEARRFEGHDEEDDSERDERDEQEHGIVVGGRRMRGSERGSGREIKEARDRGVVVPADDEVALLLSLNTTRGS